jgi:hypothetical protein
MFQLYSLIAIESFDPHPAPSQKRFLNRLDVKGIILHLQQTDNEKNKDEKVEVTCRL